MALTFPMFRAIFSLKIGQLRWKSNHLCLLAINGFSRTHFARWTDPRQFDSSSLNLRVGDGFRILAVPNCCVQRVNPKAFSPKGIKTIAQGKRSAALGTETV
jgi:hypothetical protein